MEDITIENCKIGLKVIKGKDWCWGPQNIHKETNKEMKGIISYIYKNNKNNKDWALVTWEDGTSNDYRIGPEKIDLKMYAEQLEFEF